MDDKSLMIVDGCVENIRQECIKHKETRYGYNTLYMAVTSDNELLVSKTKDILLDAQRCYIIHRWQQIAVTNYYATFLIQSVNENYEVGEGELDADFSFRITNDSFSYPSNVELYRKGARIYSEHLYIGAVERLPQLLKFIWQLYSKCRSKGASLFECRLLGKIASQENRIEELKDKLASSEAEKKFIEEEMKQYRSILNNIEKLLEK